MFYGFSPSPHLWNLWLISNEVGHLHVDTASDSSSCWFQPTWRAEFLRRTFRPWLAPIPPSSALPAWHWWFAVSRWEGPWVLEISWEEGGVHIVTWFHHIYPWFTHDFTIFHHVNWTLQWGFMGFHEAFWHRFVGQKNHMGFLRPQKCQVMCPSFVAAPRPVQPGIPEISRASRSSFLGKKQKMLVPQLNR